MSFTRFFDDENRIAKQLQQSTDPGRYILSVPGNHGDKPMFYNDPQIRMQKWGANLMTNTINLESDLKGLTRNMNRDCTKTNDFMKTSVSSRSVSYPEYDEHIEQSRTIAPAWEIRTEENDRWNYLHFNPQNHVCYHFQNNLSSRILEKDHFKLKSNK